MTLKHYSSKCIVAVFLLLSINSSAQNQQSNREILIEVNPIWAGLDWSPKNHFSGTTFTDKIEYHLNEVVLYLRAQEVSTLSLAQTEERAKTIAILAAYANERNYPQNNIHPHRKSIFIDSFGTHCAVGHLMKETGAENLAQVISQEDQLIKVRDISFPEAKNWGEDHGLGVDEMALIQPSYPWTPWDRYRGCALAFTISGDLSLHSFLAQPSSLTNNFDTDQNGSVNEKDEFIQINFAENNIYTESLGGVQIFIQDSLLHAFANTDSITGSEPLVLVNDWDDSIPLPSNYIDLNRTTPMLSNTIDTIEFKSIFTVAGLIYTFDSFEYAYSLTSSFSCLSSSGLPLSTRPMTPGMVTVWDSISSTITPPNFDSMAAPLPVDMLFFVARMKEGTAELSWATAMEENNSHFLVQHSSNNEEYTTLTIQEGKGTTNEISEYSYVHNNPIAENYYRLIQVDYDGTKTTSDVIYLQDETKEYIVSKNQNVVEITTLNRRSFDYEVVDMNGKIIRSGNAEGSLKLNHMEFSKGVYVVKTTERNPVIHKVTLGI